MAVHYDLVVNASKMVSEKLHLDATLTAWLRLGEEQGAFKGYLANLQRALNVLKGSADLDDFRKNWAEIESEIVDGDPPQETLLKLTR